MLPVARHQAATSLIDPWSVAISSTVALERRVFIACAVFTIGSGQDRPRASIDWVISMTGMSCSFVLQWSDEDDLALAGIEEEGGHALHAVDERVEVRRFEGEQVHRQRARL